MMYINYVQSFMLLSKSAQNCLFLRLRSSTFVWTEACATAFTILKSKLTQAPILVYFQFRVSATSFVVQTDASAVGLGAVLEQDNRVIVYASQALSKSECNYSTIQKECLAIVFAMKQFRHYFLGCPFTLMTDHAPLQWLSAQKMEGPLLSVACRCVITLATSSPPLPVAVTSTTEDPVLQQVQQALSQSHETPNTATWHHSPLKRYCQLWHQLSIIDGIVCHTYQPGPA